jgi:hypothetical protein
MSGVEEIKEVPKFKSGIDGLLLDEFRKRNPNLAHIIERISEESARGAWIEQKLVELNNSYVKSLTEQQEATELLRKILECQEAIKSELESVSAQSESNAKTILDWTIRFKSPLAIIGAFVGIVVTAFVGAWISRLFSGQSK